MENIALELGELQTWPTLVLVSMYLIISISISFTWQPNMHAYQISFNALTKIFYINFRFILTDFILIIVTHVSIIWIACRSISNMLV